ncbi:MAG: hypothetical protein WBD31_20890, partial [Rubripirellula sp.]
MASLLELFLLSYSRIFLNSLHGGFALVASVCFLTLSAQAQSTAYVPPADQLPDRGMYSDQPAARW